MKKSIIVALVGIFCLSFVISAQAETVLVTDGVVTATCHPNKTAEVTVPVGWQIDFYSYEKYKVLPAGKQLINLNRGRRFNIVKSDTVHLSRDDRTYALLTPDMAAYPPELFGNGVGLDCGNAAGCCFLITCQERKE
jgi:hypothetical protein